MYRLRIALVGLTLLLLLLLLWLLLGSDAVFGASRYGQRNPTSFQQRNAGDPSAYYRTNKPDRSAFTRVRETLGKIGFARRSPKNPSQYDP
jgi:hypothetical protein